MKKNILSIIILSVIFLLGARVGIIDSPIFGTSTKFSYGTASTVPYFDADKNLVSSSVTPTELGYVSGVDSAIQTQLDGKAPALGANDNYVSDTEKNNIGNLGSAAYLTAGTSANNAVQLDGTAKLPAVDGSQLTNLPSSGQLIVEDGGYGLDNGSVGRGTVGTNAVSLEYSSTGYDYGATGDYSHAEGSNTTASGYSSHAEGCHTTASGDYSHAEGFESIASHYSEHAHASGVFNDSGDCQSGKVQARTITFGTGKIELYLNGTTKRLTLNNEDAYTCRITFMGVQADGSVGDAVYQVKIHRQGTTTALSQTVRTILAWDADANLGVPTIHIEADDTNDALVVSVTAANTTYTRWTALIEYVKINH